MSQSLAEAKTRLHATIAPNLVEAVPSWWASGKLVPMPAEGGPNLAKTKPKTIIAPNLAEFKHIWTPGQMMPMPTEVGPALNRTWLAHIRPSGVRLDRQVDLARVASGKSRGL